MAMVDPDFSGLLTHHNVDRLLRQYLQDDMPSWDVGGMVVGSSIKCAKLWLKSSGVFAGKPYVDYLFNEILGCTVEWQSPFDTREGVYIDVSHHENNKVFVASVSGPVHLILRGERTALNILSRCSGVATAARAAVDYAKSPEFDWQHGLVAGTRKTTPGFGAIEKYGLLVGGAATHRLDLSQMVMLKDNNIWACGSIDKAVRSAKRAAGFTQKVEVECQSLEEALEAVESGADIIMLDNFEPSKLKCDAHVLKQKYPHIIIEASGGITLDNMKDYLSKDVDVISQGSLTQGYETLDYSLKVIP